MLQQEIVQETKGLTPSKVTLSIAEEGTPPPETWDDLQNNETEVLLEEPLSQVSDSTQEEFHAETRAFSAAGLEAGLKLWEILGKSTGIDTPPKSTYVLPLEDRDGLHYKGERFRSPQKGNYRKLFWTDSLYPCGYFEFYIKGVSRARPTNPKIADGYYIPDITIIPAKAWTWLGCKLTVKAHCSNPVRSETPEGLVVANMDILISMELLKLMLFPWRSKLQFRISGDKTELTRI